MNRGGSGQRVQVVDDEVPKGHPPATIDAGHDAGDDVGGAVPEAQLRDVLDAILAYVAILSPDGVVLEVNRAPVVMGRIARAELVGRRFADLPWFAHAAADRARVAEALARAARGDKARAEISIRTAAGETFHFDAAFVPVRDPAGRISHLVGTGVDVTARKQAEAALARSESRLAEAQRVAHVGSWEWDVAANQVTWSDELYRIYGVGKDDWRGSYEGFLARVHPDDLEHTTTVIQQALAASTPFIYDHRVVRPDGAVRMLHTRGDVIPDADGRPLRMVGSCWDVTERWQATQRLERTISILRSTLESTADGILVVDNNGKVSALNERLLALWQLPGDTKAGVAVAELIAAVQEQLCDPPGFVSATDALYAQPELERLDVLRFTDGRVFERYSRPQHEGKKIVGRVCSFRDVTQRERLLRSAETARAAAESARRELENILERVSDGFTGLDRAWRYTYVNSAGARMLGRDPDSLRGKHIWSEFPEGIGQKFHLAYERAATAQKPVAIREYYPPWDRWFENRIYPSPDGLSIFFTDVTEQQRTQEQLRASADQLRALGARLDQIREEERKVIAREIHDQIGQALTALKLDLASVRARLPAEVASDLVERVGAMDRLLDDTLATARRLSTELRPAIVDDLGLGPAIAWQAREVEQRTGIACVTHLPEDAVVPGHAALVLFRIVQEALTNVVRHAGARTISISLAVTPAAITLTVADDGRGITPEELARPSSLGLAGMRERALVLGGEVTIERQPQGGTVVRVRLPGTPP